jgi:hypothetical protein
MPIDTLLGEWLEIKNAERSFVHRTTGQSLAGVSSAPKIKLTNYPRGVPGNETQHDKTASADHLRIRMGYPVHQPFDDADKVFEIGK